jgi:hypothetical protein
MNKVINSIDLTKLTLHQVSNQEIKEAIENYIPENNRSQLIHKNENEIILEYIGRNVDIMTITKQRIMLREMKKRSLKGMIKIEEVEKIIEEEINFLEQFNKGFLSFEDNRETTLNIVITKRIIQLKQELTKLKEKK